MPQQQVAQHAIHRLPVELVAQVLQFVPQADRLQHCALVSTTWREAAAAATQSITGSRLCQEQVSLLSEWLQAHGAAGQLTHLGVSGYPTPTLQLPAAAISKLRSLELNSMDVTVSSAASAEFCSSDLSTQQLASQQAAVVLPVSQLTALTSLQANWLCLDLRGMSACQLLKRLVLERVQLPTSLQADESLSSTVASALPALTDLTTLDLTGSYDVSVAACISSLSKLQELSLFCGACMVEKAVAALPPSLTSLALSTGGYDPIYQDPATLSLGKYTNLWSLSVTKGGLLVGLADIAQLTQLHTCIISASNISEAAEAEAGAGPSGLSALATLTALQHLSLEGLVVQDSPWHLSLSTADCAALTASTQLTYLSLSQWQLSRELCNAVLPAGRVLPHLQELQLGPCFLRDAAGAAALACACPNLTSLVVAVNWPEWYDDYMGSDDGEFDNLDDGPDVVLTRPCLDGLPQLQSLQRLHLDDVRFTRHGIWDSISQLTALTELHAGKVRIGSLPGILQLVVLEDLRVLRVEFQQGYLDTVLFVSQGLLLPFTLPAAVVSCAAELLEMAIEEESWHELQQLLSQVPDLCAAAVTLGFQLQRRNVITLETMKAAAHYYKVFETASITPVEHRYQEQLQDIDKALQAAVEAEQTEAGSNALLSPGQLATWQQQWEGPPSKDEALLTFLCAGLMEERGDAKMMIARDVWQEVCRQMTWQADALQSAIKRCKACAENLRRDCSAELAYELSDWVTQ